MSFELISYPLSSAALFVLLPASAGTRVISTDFFGYSFNRFFGGRGITATGKGQVLLFGLLQGIDVVRLGQLYPEKNAQGFRLDAVDGFLEHLEAFFFVYQQRVLLGIPAQPDAFLEMIHGEQMILPEVIHRLQDDVTLKLPKLLFSDLGLFITVSFNGIFISIPDSSTSRSIRVKKSACDSGKKS